MKSLSNNIILTGLPRSGTTLTCHLFNKLPDCVALHEPINPLQLKERDNSNSLIDEIGSFFEQQRQQILTEGWAASKSNKGGVPDNPMAGIDPSTGKRIRVLDGNIININKKMDETFYLLIKQPSFFTAILGQLCKYYPCYAIVRNPISVLLSWNSVDMPVCKGHAPAAEAFDPALRDLLQSESDLYNRQIKLLNWFFQQYLIYLPMNAVINYEKIIDTHGKVLKCIVKSANTLDVRLQSKNNNPIYSLNLKNLLVERLQSSEYTNAIWAFYNRDTIA